MAITSTIPARTFQPLNAARGSVKYQSPESLKLVNSAESTRLHLSNLEKLLHKEAGSHSEKVVEKVPIARRNYKNFLEHLSLSAIWPEMSAAEEVSPRNLHRLRRLLSMTAEYSPRNNLAGRWREYHGESDWAGLLDPLDENLRREIVRYGEFVQAAYHSFSSESAAVGLPDKSYVVTKTLHATSSVELPKWVETDRSSRIGFVAVCDDKQEIQRMGRRDILIALRGTCTCLEWAENLRAQLAPISAQPDPTQEQPKVGCGFLNLYKTRGAHVPSLSESVVAEVQRLMELYKGETLSITVTGHSLGAALALLVADELSTSVPDAPPVAVFSFGSPRVGNQEFANRINRKNIKVLRIVNSEDVITRVPANPVKEGLNERLRNTGVKTIIDAIDRNMSWEYAHVGTELRVETKMSPYLKPNADMACCHDLEAYLHLVDGFVASNGPFRANAKRSLVKLVDEQGSNVKKLYKSKAKSLSSLNIRRNGLHMVPANCLPSPS